jgi:cell division protein FtsB
MKLKRSKSTERRGVSRPPHQFARVWGSRGFVVVLIAVNGFLGISVFKEVLRRMETQQEITEMQEEVARLETRNTELQDLIALLNTSSAQEKQARVKLSVQRPGEQVVMLPGQRQEPEIVLPNADRIDYLPVSDYTSNPEKWFHFFWDKIDKPS